MDKLSRHHEQNVSDASATHLFDNHTAFEAASHNFGFARNTARKGKITTNVALLTRGLRLSTVYAVQTETTPVKIEPHPSSLHDVMNQKALGKAFRSLWDLNSALTTC